MRGAFCIGLLLPACILAGCARHSGGKPPAAEAAEGDGGAPAAITYQIWDDEKSYLSAAVEEWCRKNPSVRVRLRVHDNDTYDDMIPGLLAQRADVDLLGMRGIQQMYKYAATGGLASLTDLIKARKVDVSKYGPAFPQMELDGLHYGLPYRSSCWCLFYNKGIFRQRGVSYPRQMTWEGYARLARGLDARQGTSRVFGGFMVKWVPHFMAIQRGVTLLDDDTDPLWESVRFLDRLYNRDGSHMDLREQQAGNVDWLDLFEKGRVAMAPNGDWSVGMLMADEAEGLTDVDWDIAPIPVPDGITPGTSFGHYTLVGLTQYGRHKAEAFSLASFLCQAEGARVLAQRGMLPAYNTPEIRDTYVSSTGRVSANIFFEAHILPEQPFHRLAAQVSEIFDAEVAAVLLGKKGIDKAQAEFERRRAEILETSR